MPHRYARIQDIADFSKGVNQAPAFMRKGQAKGAAAEMEDLVIDLNGRPVPRKGYVNVDTSDITVGTADGNNTSGDRLYVAHYLGDRDHIEAVWSFNNRTWSFNDRTWVLEKFDDESVKRIYYFDDDESWATDPTGRLIYVVREGRSNYFIDVKENRRYFWDLTPPPEGIEIRNANIIHRGQSISLVNRRNEGEIEAGVREVVNFFTIINRTDRADTGVYAIVGLATDVRNIEIYVDEIDSPASFDDRRATLFRGYLEQGTYAFYWDLHNFDGNPVDPLAGDGSDGHKITVAINETEGYHRSMSYTPSGEIHDELALALNIKAKRPSDVPVERFSVGRRTRVGCFTYSNPDLLEMETRPTKLFSESFYQVIDNSLDADIQQTITIDLPDGTSPIDWVSNLNLYVSDDTPEPDFDLSQNAGATGLTFYRNASVTKRSDGTFSAAGIIVKRGEKILDSFDHDHPDRQMNKIAPHGVGLWGAVRNTVYFSKIGNLGEQRLYAMPSEHALVSHSFDLVGGGQSPVVAIHPAAHVTGLLAFKRDAIHTIRGRGVIEGLYNPETPVQVDLDASSVLVGTGTSAPNTVLTVGSGVYFVSSDKRFCRYGLNWRGQVDMDKKVGLPIQRYLDELTDEEISNLTAFLYQDCYHLITPERVLIMDMTRKYWTSASWQLKDAFWSRGGLDSESILYGVKQDNTLIELYRGDTDGGANIGGTWQSNPISIPSESVLTGVMAVHTTNPPPELTCSITLDDVEDPEPRNFTPAKYNDFRYGTHKSGSRVSVKLSSDDGFPLLDRIQAEVFIVR